MGVITISIDDNVEEKLRKIARARFNTGKGHLSMAITEAINEWTLKDNEDSIAKALELLEKGIKMKKVKFTREELHER